MIPGAPSRLHVFEGLLDRCRPLGPMPMAVAAPTTEVALAGALEAARRHLIEPILVGSEREIGVLARRINLDLGATVIVDASDDEDAARRAVGLCRSGQGRYRKKCHRACAHDWRGAT